MLGTPSKELQTNRQCLLYRDDRQVKALSVSCNHGEDRPAISVTAMPHSVFLDDLRLAMHAESEFEDQDNDIRHEDALNEFLELLNEQHAAKSVLSDAAYNSLLDMSRRSAQEQLLGGAKVRLSDLGYLNGIGSHSSLLDDRLSQEIVAMHDPLFKMHPVRVLLTELPHKKGTSDAYKKQIEAKFRTFKQKFGRVIQPLMIPVVLQVVIKPPASIRALANHDLDNVVRTYLLPKIVELLQPPGDHLWTVDLKQMKLNSPELYKSWGEKLKFSPASTRIGVTRYEAWQLTRVKGDKTAGFVSIAVVAEDFHRDLVSRIDATINKWEDTLD